MNWLTKMVAAKTASRRLAWLVPHSAMLAVMVVALCGCASMEILSYRTIGTVTISVEAARSTWNQYVKDGHATPDQMIQAQDVYTKYQSAMLVLSDIVTAAKAVNPSTDSGQATPVWQAAIDAVSASAADFVALIGQFTQPTATPQKVGK